MKIVVYAITKNEIDFVDRWYESMKEADDIYVMDTGSTDGTADRMKELGIHVTRKTVMPWRFDTARNASLALVPKGSADLLVCTDIDEYFSKPGWRKMIEDRWTECIAQGHRPTQVRYTYINSFFDNGDPDCVLDYGKIHVPELYEWTRMLHEYVRLKPGMTGYKLEIPELILEHHTKDKTDRRSSQTDLCALWVQQEPWDPDAWSYYAHYLMAQGKLHEAMEACDKSYSLCLSVKGAPTFKLSELHRFKARLWQTLGEYAKAEAHLLNACVLFNQERAAYLDLAEMYLQQRRWLEAALISNRGMGSQADGPDKNTSSMLVQSADLWSYRLPYIRFIGFANAGWKKEAEECLKVLQRDFPDEPDVQAAIKTWNGKNPDDIHMIPLTNKLEGAPTVVLT